MSLLQGNVASRVELQREVTWDEGMCLHQKVDSSLFCLQRNFRQSLVSVLHNRTIPFSPLLYLTIYLCIFSSPNKVWHPGWNCAGCMGVEGRGNWATMAKKKKKWCPDFLIPLFLCCYRLEKVWRPGWWVKPLSLLLFLTRFLDFHDRIIPF